MYSSQTDN